MIRGVLVNNKIDVTVYGAVKMSGENKAELVKRAKRVYEIFTEEKINFISPVIEEQVEDKDVKLINNDKERLRGFWTRDKEILIKEAHVMFWDHAEQKSFGCEREYGFMRFCLWKPVVIYIPPGTPLSVAEFEDDVVVNSVHEAAKIIVERWGTAEKRRAWRMEMLKRTWKNWLIRQYLGWR